MLTTILLIATAAFLRQLYRPGPGRSRQAGVVGAIAAGGAAAAAAAKAAALAAAAKAAATAGAVGAKTAAAGAAKAGATTAAKAGAGAAKAATATKAAAGAKGGTAAAIPSITPTATPASATGPPPPVNPATGGAQGGNIISDILSKGPGQQKPPSISSIGATTPPLSKGAGLLDSAKSAGGDTSATLAKVVQQTIDTLKSAPISRKELLVGAAKDIAVGQITAPPEQRQAPPEIGSLAASTPAFQAGGVSPPGQPFIAGEAGGAPEMVTPAPDGSNVVTPLAPEQAQAIMGGQQGTSRARQGVPAPAAQPTQAQPATGQPTQQPAEFDPISFLSKLGDFGQDAAVAMMLGNPALIIDLQQNRAEQRRFLAGQALQNPSILTSSPEAAQAYESLFGEGSAMALLKENAPGAAARRQAISLGLNILPPGTLDSDGKPAPGTAEQINKWAFDHGMDFRLGSDGLQLSRNAPSHEEISSALSYSIWGTMTQAYRDSGMEHLEAARTAAKNVMVELSRKNFVIPPRLRDLAMEDVTSDLDSKHAAALAEATSTVELAFKSQMATAEARGREIGQAQGEAAAAATEMEIVKSDGTVVRIPLTQAPEFLKRTSEMAEVISGIPGAVDMGTNPSKTLVNNMALKGMDIMEDSAGNMIALPIGNKFGGRKITGGQLASGPESAARLKEIVRILDKVEAIPNVLDSFPSEKTVGRVRARSAGYLKSWVRNLTDSPGLLTGRGAVRRMGFHMARLAGSNSQLSDAERADAGAIYQPFRDGTGTREQIEIGFKWARDHVANKLEGLRYPGIKPQAAPPVGGSPTPPSPAGAFVAPSQDLSEFVLTLPDGSTVVAERVQ